MAAYRLDWGAINTDWLFWLTWRTMRMSVTTMKMQQVLSVLMVCVLQHCIAQTQGGGTHKNTHCFYFLFFSVLPWLNYNHVTNGYSHFYILTTDLETRSWWLVILVMFNDLGFKLTSWPCRDSNPDLYSWQTHTLTHSHCGCCSVGEHLSHP